MDLIALAKEAGLTPKRTGKTCCSPCPACNGNDRFIIWPEDNKYWCRRCERHGDAIQFCRDFLGLSYFDACMKLNIKNSFKNQRANPEKEKFHISKHPSGLWLQRALVFTLWAHQQLMHSCNDISSLLERGLKLETINKFHLGLCRDPDRKMPTDLFRERPTWGLDKEYHNNGKEKKLWLPYGIVIPHYAANNQVVKLKIRRLGWYDGDKFPKYVEVAGSIQQPSWLGLVNELPTVIVEAEFDAILIQQEAGDLCAVMALGGAKKRPDLATHQRLKKSPLLLYALDFDEAGKEQFIFWRNTYSQLRAWPVPKEKSPGDAFKRGISIRQWIIDGLFEYEKLVKRNHYERQD